jgi:hypothetical protein
MIQITVNRVIPDSAIFLQGAKRSVMITALEAPESAPPASEDEETTTNVVPLIGALVVVGGLLESTFDLPDHVVDEGQGPEKYQVELGDTPLIPVAIKGNEIAVVGTGIQAPASGTQTVTVISPSGASASNTVELWSYEILPQPVTHINQWAPISLQCNGYAGNIQITFFPETGQVIEPLQQELPCQSVSVPTPIGQYMTATLGPQPLNATVERVE